MHHVSIDPRRSNSAPTLLAKLREFAKQRGHCSVTHTVVRPRRLRSLSLLRAQESGHQGRTSHKVSRLNAAAACCQPRHFKLLHTKPKSTFRQTPAKLYRGGSSLLSEVRLRPALSSSRSSGATLSVTNLAVGPRTGFTDANDPRSSWIPGCQGRSCVLKLSCG